MRDMMERLFDLRLLRYLAASVAALCADVATFWLLIQGQMNDALASAIGYSVGILIHWLLSSRMVFVDGVATSGMARSRQKGLFALSALAGLAVTTAIVGTADWLGLNTLIAKLFAVGVSFALTYILRAKIVFRASPPVAATATGPTTGPKAAI